MRPLKTATKSKGQNKISHKVHKISINYLKSISVPITETLKKKILCEGFQQILCNRLCPQL